MSKILKTLVAGIATATVALAFAQGTPPNPGVANPALGAGQQSSQGTSMGTTGTPGGSGATAQGTTAGGGAATSAGSTSTPATSSGSMASDGMGTSGSSQRVAKADRG